MNAQSKVEGRDLMNPADIASICEDRSKAIALWLETYDRFHESTGLAGRLMIGPALSLEVGKSHRDHDQELARAFMATGEITRHCRETYRTEKVPAREEFERLATREIDRRCWHGLCDRLGFETIMDRQAREEFRETLSGDDVPEFTAENCAATFGGLWSNRREIYLRGIANVFSALDRRFRSHDGFKVGGRIIINNAFEWSSWRNYNKRDTLQDVERIFYELEGEEQPAVTDELSRELNKQEREGVKYGRLADLPITRAAAHAWRTESLPHVIKGRFFRVRIFNNGNLHIWFERADLLKQVNILLAEYYGEAIGDAYTSTEADDAPEYHATPAKNFGAFNTSPELARQVLNYTSGLSGRVLEPSAGTGELAKAARESGGNVECIEIQEGLAHELAKTHGFRTWQGDFLKVKPGQLGAPYDAVIMNPPFDRGRDCDHVRHALQFLRPGGLLLAIMSARAEHGEDKRHKALHREIEKCEAGFGRSKWIDLPAGSFAHAGTNVNTVLLVVRKPT